MRLRRGRTKFPHREKTLSESTELPRTERSASRRSSIFFWNNSSWAENVDFFIDWRFLLIFRSFQKRLKFIFNILAFNNLSRFLTFLLWSWVQAPNQTFDRFFAQFVNIRRVIEPFWNTVDLIISTRQCSLRESFANVEWELATTVLELADTKVNDLFGFVCRCFVFTNDFWGKA